MFFLQKVIKQNGTNMTSVCMQFKKVGCGLLWKLFEESRSAFLAEREGENKKRSVLENAVNTEAIRLFI